MYSEFPRKPGGVLMCAVHAGTRKKREGGIKASEDVAATKQLLQLGEQVIFFNESDVTGQSSSVYHKQVCYFE